MSHVREQNEECGLDDRQNNPRTLQNPLSIDNIDYRMYLLAKVAIKPAHKKVPNIDSIIAIA